MISIIICSRSKEAVQIVSENVAATIGVPYEVIAIDNSRGEYSIFQAYNRGLKQSKYNMLCFMHEDISFDTIDWGGKVLDLFNAHPRLGLLGVAGSSYKSVIPSGWAFANTSAETVKINMVQHYKGEKNPEKLYNNFYNESLAKVASVDGLWFCTPKVVAEKFRFDEATYTGFHCYDVDYSLSVLQEYDVAVTFDVLINHFSEGSLNESWITETLKLHKKWKGILPVNLNNFPENKVATLEFDAFHAILPRLVGKREIAFDFVRTLCNDRVIAAVGIKRFITMTLVVLKKGFEKASG